MGLFHSCSLGRAAGPESEKIKDAREGMRGAERAGRAGPRAATSERLHRDAASRKQNFSY